jgi:uncharacterized membrane protein
MIDERQCTVWKSGPLVRVELLSDAVFAIAITLLILDIKVPDSTSPAELPDALRKLWPHCFAYFLSFAIVALQWVDHHHIFHNVGRCTWGLFWVNFVFLCCIAFLPFPTDVLRRFPDVRVSAVFYSEVIACTILAKFCLWIYIVRCGRLLKQGLSHKVVRSMTLRWFVGLCCAALLTALAYFWPRVAMAFWGIFGIVSIILRLREPHESETSQSRLL